jgi:hypothetical protein
MSYSDPLILQVHLVGAEPYEIGDEIWQHPSPTRSAPRRTPSPATPAQNYSRGRTGAARSRGATTS